MKTPPTAPCIQSYLKGIVEARLRLPENAAYRVNGYVGLDDFVLRQGVPWRPGPKPRSIKFGPIKNCFQNATELTLSHPDLIYCEGYALSLIPMLHAWCVTPDGNVIDNTWRKRGLEYFGIAFQRQYLVAALLSNKYYGLIDAWTSRWPLLREEPDRYLHPIMSQPMTVPA